MITDITLIPIGATALTFYVIVGGSLLFIHGIFITPIIYAKTGKVVYSHKEIAKFYGKKKIVPTV